MPNAPANLAPSSRVTGTYTRRRYYGLQQEGQSDFSGGMHRLRAREQIPQNAAWDMENCVLDDVGHAPRRAGTTYLTGAFGSTGLTFVWDGTFTSGRKTLVANDTAFGLVSTGDATVTNIGGTGLHYPVRPALVKDKLFFPGGQVFDGTTTLGTAVKPADVYASAGGKLIACNGNQAFMSAYGDPTKFDPFDYHQLPEGVTIIGAEGARTVCALFTTAGVWTISNVELQLTDAFGNVQQRLDRFSRDLVLWGESGLAGWQGGLVVPAMDGVWLMNVGQDTAAGPAPFRRISDPVSDVYNEYVRVGFRPGGATVYQGHYLLPILNGPSVVDMLVCRLDSGAWTRFSGQGGNITAYTVRTGGASRQPILLGAQRDTSSKVTSCHYFEVDASRADADGTVGRWQIITRDYLTNGALNKSLVKRLRAEFLMVDPTTTNPSVTASYAVEEPSASYTSVWGGSTWGGTTWSDPNETFTDLTGAAPEDPTGAVVTTWLMGVKPERIRLRFRCTALTGKLTLRNYAMHIRQSGHP